jgi:aminoglycoside phosphotransferase (APT) family kinase protein
MTVSENVLALKARQISALAAAIGIEHPDEQHEPLKVIGRGFYNLAVETASGFVFLMPHNAASAERQAVEARLLPVVAPRLPLAVPVPSWIVPRGPDLPWGAIGYRKLEGSALPPGRPEWSRDAARQLAQFLVALHSFPVKQAVSLGVRDASRFKEYLQTLSQNVMAVLAEHLNTGENKKIEAWWRDVLDERRLEGDEAVLCHGDLLWDNVLFAESRIAGVLDWEWAAVGDPATDIATWLRNGPEFMQMVLDQYASAGGRVGNDIDRRIQKHWEIRPFFAINHAAYDSPKDPNKLEDSIARLRAGPILAGG